MTHVEEIRERGLALQGFPGQTLPEPTADTLARADEIVSGTVRFYNRTPVAVGLKGIDWSGAHVHHQEWPAQLNRFFYLGPLAAAYLKTRDEKYAAAARSYLEDWFSGWDYRGKQELRPGDNTLNISIRLGTSMHGGWGGTLPAFLDSPSFDEAFVDRIADSMAGQAEFLARNLTRVANWRISQLDALVFTALRLPFLPEAEELLRFAIGGMRNALATQFLPDGVHTERTPGYADWMTEVAVSYLLLARRFPEADAKVDVELVEAALDYLAQSQFSAINDAGVAHRDPEKLRNLERRHALLRRIYPDEEIEATPPTAQVFPYAGHVFVRSEWKPGAEVISFDASTWGGGHCHLSRLSFSFRAGGRLLVADPGILSYEMSDPMGPYGKSTPAHSTLNLDGLSQSLADAVLQQTDFTPQTALIEAQYQGGYFGTNYTWGFGDGLGAGRYGDHRRLLFWVRGEYLLVLDQMCADRGAMVHNVWQMGPMEGWAADPATLSWHSKNADTNLHLQVALAPEGTAMECFEGSLEPRRGWIGWHGDDSAPAPQAEFRYPARLPGVTTAVLLAAVQGDAACPYQVKAAGSDGYLHHVELQLPGGVTDHLAWTRSLELPIEDGAPLVSDSPFVWLRRDASGEPMTCYALDGSYVDCGGTRLFDFDTRDSRLVTFEAAGEE
jgi:hypothetical protein